MVEQQQSSWLVQRLQASAGPQSFVAVMDWLLNDPAYGITAVARCASALAAIL